MNSNNVYHFFMSATTPKGFVSHLSSLANQMEYKNSLIIKGGAGSGKSTLIKRTAEKLKNENYCELIHCSADPSSLDAAVFKETSLTVIDATAPHIVEPTLPGLAHKVVSLYNFFDNKKLDEYKSEIYRAAEGEEIYQRRAHSFLRAAGMLLSSNEKLAARCINKEKLINFITRFCAREIKGKKAGVGSVKIRYLSAVSENGILMYTDTAEKMCKKIIKIDDTNSAAAPLILEGVSKTATMAGYDVYVCLCPLSDSDKIDHLLIPELSLAVMTSNKFHPVQIENAKTVHTSRFYDREKLSEYTMRTSFQRRAARELLKEASVFLKKRLECHRRLDNYYVQACDFEERDKYFDSFIEEFV